MKTKQEIISHIHTLVSNNVIGDKQLMSRYKGFKGELCFESYIKKTYGKYELLDGGIIFSIDNSESSLNNSIYLTVTNQLSNLEDYKKIYAKLSNIGFVEMFIVFYDAENWTLEPVMNYPNDTIQLPIPDLTIKTYDIKNNQFNDTNDKISLFSNLFQDVPIRKKNTYPIESSSKTYLLKELTQFDFEDLIKMYLNRLFLDGFIGFGKQKGKISDIDLILKRPDGDYRLIEIKEKDLAKKIVGFGLDVPRLDDMLRITEFSSLNYYLVVRHINNQTKRELVGWKTISINDFSDNVKGQKSTEGGTGMRSISSKNPTVICKLNNFSKI